MTRRIYRLAALTVASLFVATSPAAADEPLAVTPSGSTEAFFDLPPVDTSDLLANSCVDYGWTTISSTETVVTCELRVSFGTQLLNALSGPRYATPPRQYIRFNIAGYRGLSRVQATAWQEIQTAFGQTQTTPMASDNYHNGVTGFLMGLGGLYPPGAIFPNHASIDVDYEFSDGSPQGMLLTAVEMHGPFGEAGLREGDIVTRRPRIRLAGIAAREADGTCNADQPCPNASHEEARDTLAAHVGTPGAFGPHGHRLVSGPTIHCVSTGGAAGNRTAAWCVSPRSGDISCAMASSGAALRWQRYWQGHPCE